MSTEGYEVIYNSLCLIRNVLYLALNEKSIKHTALYGFVDFLLIVIFLGL